MRARRSVRPSRSGASPVLLVLALCHCILSCCRLISRSAAAEPRRRIASRGSSFSGGRSCTHTRHSMRARRRQVSTVLTELRAAAVTAAAGSLRRCVHDHRQLAPPRRPHLGSVASSHMKCATLAMLVWPGRNRLLTSPSCSAYSVTSPSSSVSGTDGHPLRRTGRRPRCVAEEVRGALVVPRRRDQAAQQPRGPPSRSARDACRGLRAVHRDAAHEDELHGLRGLQLPDRPAHPLDRPGDEVARRPEDALRADGVAEARDRRRRSRRPAP